jgi:hypothetical protein
MNACYFVLLVFLIKIIYAMSTQSPPRLHIFNFASKKRLYMVKDKFLIHIKMSLPTSNVKSVSNFMSESPMFSVGN